MIKTLKRAGRAILDQIERVLLMFPQDEATKHMLMSAEKNRQQADNERRMTLEILKAPNPILEDLASAYAPGDANVLEYRPLRISRQPVSWWKGYDGVQQPVGVSRKPNPVDLMPIDDVAQAKVEGRLPG